MAQGSCEPEDHEWIVWDDGEEPVHEFGTNTSEEAVWTSINEDPAVRYAECNLCGRVLNA